MSASDPHGVERWLCGDRIREERGAKDGLKPGLWQPIAGEAPRLADAREPAAAWLQPRLPARPPRSNRAARHRVAGVGAAAGVTDRGIRNVHRGAAPLPAAAEPLQRSTIGHAECSRQGD